MEKRVIPILLLLCLPFHAHAGTVGVLYGKNIKAYHLVLQGVGSAEGIKYKEYPFDELSDEEKNVVIKNLTSDKPDVVIAIGSTSLTLAQENLQELPIVFSMVVHTEDAGQMGENVCGISLEISPRKQFDILKKTLPSMRNLGVIFDPAESLRMIREARSSAKELGIHLIESQISSMDGIGNALEGLKGKIDAFWMLPDPVIANPEAFRYLLLFSFKGKIPVIAPSYSLVEKGAFLSVGAEFTSIGRQAGEIARAILTGKRPRDIGIQPPSHTETAINLKTAEIIGLRVPEPILTSAGRVFH